jgi:hypothetical protein
MLHKARHKHWHPLTACHAPKHTKTNCSRPSCLALIHVFHFLLSCFKTNSEQNISFTCLRPSCLDPTYKLGFVQLHTPPRSQHSFDFDYIPLTPTTTTSSVWSPTCFLSSQPLRCCFRSRLLLLPASSRLSSKYFCQLQHQPHLTKRKQPAGKLSQRCQEYLRQR